MGPPATGEAGTQVAMTALQWIPTLLQVWRPCGEKERERGRVGELSEEREGDSHRSSGYQGKRAN